MDEITCKHCGRIKSSHSVDGNQCFLPIVKSNGTAFRYKASITKTMLKKS